MDGNGINLLNRADARSATGATTDLVAGRPPQLSWRPPLLSFWNRFSFRQRIFEADPALRLLRRLFHHLPQHLGNGLDLVVVQPHGLAELGDLLHEFPRRGKQAAQPNEGPA
jgi:hypothetical protein